MSSTKYFLFAQMAALSNGLPGLSLTRPPDPRPQRDPAAIEADKAAAQAKRDRKAAKFLAAMKSEKKA